MSLVARHLETNGLPALIIGSAIDIVQYCGVPRYVHVDFPLGNPCGKPWDAAMQLAIMQQAMAFFATASTPGSVLRLAYRWSEDESWRDRYARVTDSNREQLRQQGEYSRQQQQLSKSQGRIWLNKID